MKIFNYWGGVAPPTPPGRATTGYKCAIGAGLHMIESHNCPVKISAAITNNKNDKSI